MDDHRSIPYFESNLAALSTIGLWLTGVGVYAILITRFSALHTIPVVASVACAVANGLSYHAFWTSSFGVNKAVASGFADVFWPTQEISLSFYSYQILSCTLTGRDRSAYRCGFWVCLLALVAVRVAILVLRTVEILHEPDFKSLIGFLHVGYFALLAVLETCSSWLLIRFFLNAHGMAPAGSRTLYLFKFLLRSTELRVSALSVIGITRATAYPFQIAEHLVVNIPNQIDRFAYTLECLFPVILM
ncbi:uncharacterized protein BJX67DRAFT_391646 [Aspergillus lucknowensis]|uniref:Uncharacterized protein n=1 Tax=Aspergillus lucknowensis TaxID=176173 RepID=A0ABR4LBY7_9EURO